MKLLCDSCNKRTEELYEIEWGNIWMEVCKECKEHFEKREKKNVHKRTKT